MLESRSDAIALLHPMKNAFQAISVADQKIECQKCHQLIKDQAFQCPLDDKGKDVLSYHPECLTCMQCGTKSLDLQQCSILDGQPFCDKCLLPTEEDVFHWCQETLKDFKGIELKDFTTSFQDGLPFAALLVNWRPDLLDLKVIRPDCPHITLRRVWEAADAAGIPPILNAEFMREADAKSIFLQLTLFRRKFMGKKPLPEGKEKWNAFMSTEMEKNVITKGEEDMASKTRFPTHKEPIIEEPRA